MKNLVKSTLYATAGLSLVGINSVNAAISAGNVQDSLKGTNASADVAIQGIVTNIITFLYLIAVLFGLWGGFNILTAAGDETKVKKGKDILIQALIGLVVIWLASSVVQWLLTKILV